MRGVEFASSSCIYLSEEWRTKDHGKTRQSRAEQRCVLGEEKENSAFLEHFLRPRDQKSATPLVLYVPRTSRLSDQLNLWSCPIFPLPMRRSLALSIRSFASVICFPFHGFLNRVAFPHFLTLIIPSPSFFPSFLFRCLFLLFLGCFFFIDTSFMQTLARDTKNNIHSIQKQQKGR